MPKALVAMSGGVDSTVSVLLAMEAGYEVEGVTLLMHGDTDVSGAAAAAAACGVPHRVLDVRERFARCVSGRMVEEYAAGRTPNPCVDCNRSVKTGFLADYARENGFERLVTGHYARTGERGGRHALRVAAASDKDQSYVLYPLSQEQLALLWLPLGEMDKREVRAYAAARGLVCAAAPDSQDICFLPDGDYAAYVTARVPCAEGEFTDRTGRVLGRHRGHVHYTVGQRRGLGVAAAERLYVLAKDAARNAVVLGTESELMTRELRAENINWVSIAPPQSPLHAMVRTRYRQRETGGEITPLPDGGASVVFDAPVRAGAPGQSAVFYDADGYVLGGGTIA
jgi:tRNA-specific 2-thiouridylase